MEVEIKLEELDRIIYQWDVVEGCKKKMILLLCRIYGNPLNLDLADLDKPAYREVPKKGIIRESVELALKIIGMICAGVFVLGTREEDYIFVLFGIPAFLSLVIWAVLYTSYSRKCADVDKYNRKVDSVFSKKIAEMYNDMMKIYLQKVENGSFEMSDSEMKALDFVGEELAYEKDKLDVMFAAAGIKTDYRKREHTVFLHDTLAWKETESWEGALMLLDEELKSNEALEK
ncbi:MAG: hypothetical protein MJ171_01070 [Clostridia bacterium]|nr:hypothetical protein [Clostridia bacterium]